MSELIESAVRKVLTSKWVGHSYRYLESAGSTNDLLKKEAATDSPQAGAVILTDYQSQGRGRLDRRWEAPPGTSLLFSVLFRPDWPSEHLPWLTMIAGTAVVEAIEAETGLNPALKWPNDVVIQHKDAWHKICGVLLEGSISADSHMSYAILGIGLNVNIPAHLLPQTVQPATSLAVVSGRAVSRLDLLAGLLQRIEYHYERADQGISPWETWNQRLITLGQVVEISPVAGEPVFSGTAEGTGEWGELLVRDKSGALHKILAGDVTLRKSEK